MEEVVDIREEQRNPGYVFPVVEADTFVDHLLPQLRDGIDAKRVESILKRRGHIDSRGRWKGLWSMSEGKKRKKYDTFAPLLDIFEKVVSVASAEAPHLEQVLEMKLIPESIEGRPWRNKSSQTACFSLRQEQSGITGRKETSWLEIALTSVFRRTGNEESRRKNARKVVSNIQLAIARDPSRRFSFGITVENTMMRLWFCSRASPVVSTPFDFSKDLDILLRVFLSLAFATREELGWDPTMRPFIRDNGSCVYHIDVDGKTYETRQLLSSSSADRMLGHATRVWKVRRLSSDGPGSEPGDESFVLKDVWIEDDREPEHSLMEKLLNDVEEKYGPEIRRKLACHLLTPIAHCFVRADGGEDHTTNVMMRGYSPSYKERYKVNVEHLGCTHDYGWDEKERGLTTEIGMEGLGRDGLRDPFPWYNPLRRIPRRKHYRVVFREVAKSVLELGDLEDFFTVLSDSAKALRWIHGAGWVHRDLSVGNLYLYKGRGLLGDFEYAKRKDTDNEDEGLIGTRDFLAVEAADRCYLHLPRQDKGLIQARLKALMEGRMEDLARLQELGCPPHFSYNDLHDLESLWWIAIWKILTYNMESEARFASADIRERAKQREVSKNLLFPPTDETRMRTLFLRIDTHYWDYSAWLRWNDLKEVLNGIRGALVDKYSKFEAVFPDIQTEIFTGTHSLFRDLFRRCRDCVREEKLRVNRELGMKCQPTKPESASSKTATQKCAPGAPARQVMQENRSRTSHRPLRGEECEDCFPKQRKRKLDTDDDGSPVRSVRKGR